MAYSNSSAKLWRSTGMTSKPSPVPSHEDSVLKISLNIRHLSTDPRLVQKGNRSRWETHNPNPQDVPRAEGLYSCIAKFWICPGVSSQCDMSGNFHMETSRSHSDQMILLS
ncbi:hypothetical protein ILYODFUR_008413 [Ilyodon furcidens]|uniref:Uncharacterized protein n=1 Tax=Ilyodon furcidens TaxID=33524 RepID=A0ABV0TH64_9TELE